MLKRIFQFPVGTLNGFASLSADRFAVTFTANDDLEATGSVTVSADYTDLAGNVGVSGSDAVEIDTENPTVLVDVVEGNLNDADPDSLVTFTFSEVPVGFELADITADKGAVSDLVMDTATTYHATFTAADEEEGVGSVTVNAGEFTDAVGNANLAATPDTVSIDTKNPTASVELTAASLSDSSNSTALTITFSEVPMGFSPGDDLSVSGGSLGTGAFDGANLVWTATYTANDDFDGSGSVGIAAGSYTDAAGNIGGGDVDTVDIDTKNPTATVMVADEDLIAGETSAVTILFSELVVGFSNDDLAVANGTISDVSSTDQITWTATLTPNAGVEAASNVIGLELSGVSDAAGNPGSGIVDSNAYSIDTLVPAVAVDTLTTNDATPGLSGEVDDATATISLTVAGQTVAPVNNGDGTWTLADGVLSALTEGVYDVVVSATDAAGNVGMDTTTDELVIGDQSLVVTVDFLMTNDTTPELTGTVDDSGAAVSVSVAGQALVATNNGDGTWVLADGSLATLSEDTYDVSVTATDVAGNQGSDTTTNELVIDTTSPVVTVDFLVTNDSTPELTGTVDDSNAVVSVSVAGQALVATNNGDGIWVLANGSLAALSEDTYDVSVTATDAAGNQGSDTTRMNW